ncbi:MAG: MFS transporter [Nanoarchaeota archaeon]
MKRLNSYIQNGVVSSTAYFSRVKIPFIILMLQAVCANLSFSFVPFFLKQQGFSLPGIVLLYTLYSGLSLATISLVQTYFLRNFLAAGFLVFSLAAVSFAVFSTSLSFFIYAFLIAINIAIYWITLNYIFFRNSQRKTNAVDSSFYMVLPGLISIIIPPLGAVFAQAFGFSKLFILSSILFIIPIGIVLKYVPQEKISTSFFNGVRNFKGLKTITLLEGSLQHFNGAIIPIYALLFLESSFDVGFFLGYVGIVGLAITLILSNKSDKSQKRKGFIKILFFLLAVSIATLFFAKNVVAWYIAVGLFTIIYTISSPLRLAISLDAKKPDLEFWKTREFFLNVGRMLTLGFAAFFFFMKSYLPLFILFGIIALVYPFVVNYKLTDIE